MIEGTDRWFTVDKNGKHIERPAGWDPSQMTDEEIKEIEEATGLAFTSLKGGSDDPKEGPSPRAHADRYMLQQWSALRNDNLSLKRRVTCLERVVETLQGHLNIPILDEFGGEDVEG